MATAPELDQERIEQLAGQVFGELGGALTAALIWLGDHLGLYREMQGAGHLTSHELAARLGLSERWVREWLHGQTAAGYIDYRGDERFELSAEAASVLADEDHPAFAAGGMHHLPFLLGEVLQRIPEAFRTGLGLTYDELGQEAAQGVERMLAPWFRHALVPVALPALDGVVEKLEAGAKVADVGCGAGVALIKMAEAFPASEFHGYELSRHALDRAAENLAAAGLSNVTFHDVREEVLTEDASFDLITTFDCIHDMAHPTDAIRAIRAAIKPDGTWFIADIHCGASLEENLAEGNPMLPMLYGFSVLCCMSSSLSTPEGEGLGTVGFGEAKARQMTREAGFTRFERHDFDNPLNAYYEVRP
jgi:SAM-dependent methyltransferase